MHGDVCVDYSVRYQILLAAFKLVQKVTQSAAGGRFWFRRNLRVCKSSQLGKYADVREGDSPSEPPGLSERATG